MSSAPLPTAVALVVTLAATIAALVVFLARAPGDPAIYLALFTGLFAIRVLGQLLVLARAPSWLPPMEQWNLMRYPILLPVQLLVLGLMGLLAAGELTPGHATGRALVVGAFGYWLAMGIRYAVRMAPRRGERWFGGAIPIVFHCVLAAFVFVLGVANA